MAEPQDGRPADFSAPVKVFEMPDNVASTEVEMVFGFASIYHNEVSLRVKCDGMVTDSVVLPFNYSTR